VGVGDQASTDCGPLAAAGDPQRVADRNDTPECGAVQPNGTPLVDAPLPRDQGRSPLRTAVDISAATCATTTFSPGYYGPAAVEKLNTLFETCGASTFTFAPGATPADSVVQFDANDPDAGVDRGALVIDNPAVTVVFGVPSAAGLGGSPVPLCERASSGTSVELSGRTALRHRAGRLAVCPADGRAAVTQIPNAALDPDGSMVSPQSQFTANSQNPSGNVLDRTLRAKADFDACDSGSGFCAISRGVSTSWRDLPVAPLVSAKLNFRSIENPPVSPDGTVRGLFLKVYGANSAELARCTWFDFGRTEALTTSIDLLGPTCSGLSGQQATVLEGSTIEATFRYTTTSREVGLEVWDMRLEINSELATAETVAPGSSWATEFPAEAVLDDDQLLSRPKQPTQCFPEDIRCRRDLDRTERSVTVRDLTFPEGSQFAAQAVPLDGLGVVIRNSGAGSSNGAWVSIQKDETFIDAKLTLEDGQTCGIKSFGFSNSSQAHRIDLLGDCADVVPTSSDLVGADLTLTYRSRCLFKGPTRVPTVDGVCDTVRIPNLQFIGVVAATDVVFDAPPESVLTTDADGSGGALAVAQVFGDVLLGGSELQTVWSGGAPGAGDTLAAPLVVGDLQVGRIVSTRTDADASVGTVCCYLPDPQLGRIQAVIDGDVWAETLVEVDSIDGTATDPRALRILDWRYCGAASCGPRRPSAAGT
jgi:hypothetical protein